MLERVGDRNLPIPAGPSYVGLFSLQIIVCQPYYHKNPCGEKVSRVGWDRWKVESEPKETRENPVAYTYVSSGGC